MRRDLRRIAIGAALCAVAIAVYLTQSGATSAIKRQNVLLGVGLAVLSSVLAWARWIPAHTRPALLVGFAVGYPVVGTLITGGGTDGMRLEILFAGLFIFAFGLCSFLGVTWTADWLIDELASRIRRSLPKGATTAKR